jgi:transposase
MNEKYSVQLTTEQRAQLEDVIRTGHRAARTQAHARILLKADTSEQGSERSDETIAEACEVSARTVQRIRRIFVTKGLDAAIHRKKSSVSRRKLDGAQEAQLVVLACSPPPEGHDRWTLSLLADRLVELKVVDAIARDTVRLTLKKTNLSLG